MSVKCPICNTQAKGFSDPQGGLLLHFQCPRCGEFETSKIAEPQVKHLDNQEKAKLSGWIFNENCLGEEPVIHTENLKRIISYPMPNILERAHRMLKYAVEKQESLSQEVNFDNPAFMALSYATNKDDLKYMMNFLVKLGYIEKSPTGQAYQYTITPKGYIKYDELKYVHVPSSQGFVAMPFGQEFEEVYNKGFAPGIRSAGYMPIRIDRKEFAGKVDDEIVAAIRGSRFVVADFSEQRQNVYFEAGFAQGLGIPVIWTCKAEDLKNIHFDVRQYNFITWENPEELAEKLEKRIKALIGRRSEDLR